ncbi:MAG: CvpA family protein [Pontibacterium sp.]
MNWADWAIVGVIGISCLLSLRNGFVKEALSLATWAAALFIAFTFVVPMDAVLESYISTPSLRRLAAFGILFVLTLIAGALISQLVAMLVKATGLSATDRILGLGFGAARGALVVVVLIMLAGQTPATQDIWWQESQLIPHFALMVDWTRDVASEIYSALWNAGR